MLKEIESKILKEIKEKKIHPLSKYFFRVKYLGLWFLGIIFIILGGLAVSMVWTVLKYGDWDIYFRLTDNLFFFIFLVFPYFWLLLFMAFALFAFWGFKKTKYGYRHKLIYIISVCIISVGVLAVFFQFAGIGRVMENFLADNFSSSYRKVNNMRGVWANPERGLLSGTIKSIENNEIKLDDFSGQNWKVNIADSRISSQVELKKDEKVKVLGEMQDENSFKAQEIRPWKCSCSRCENSNGDCFICDNACENIEGCHNERKRSGLTY